MGLIWMIPVGRSRSLVTRLLERSTGTGANRSNERWGLEIRPFPLHIYRNVQYSTFNRVERVERLTMLPSERVEPG